MNNMSQMYEDGKKALTNNLSTLRSNIKSPLKINRYSSFTHAVTLPSHRGGRKQEGGSRGAHWIVIVSNTLLSLSRSLSPSFVFTLFFLDSFSKQERV